MGKLAALLDGSRSTSVAEFKEQHTSAIQAALAQKASYSFTAPAPPSRMQQKLDDRHETSAYLQYAEINRIIGLPIINPMDDSEFEAYNHNNIQSAAIAEGWRLFPIQAESVAAYESYDGLFGPIGVGWGKTLVTLMVASKAYSKGMRKILLLIPSQVLHQLTKIDIPWARSRIAINFPIHVLGGKGKDYRRGLSKSGKKGLYIMPYSLLSTGDTHKNLADINPELIICDEVHHLRNRSAARTRRMMEYIDVHRPEGVCLSGTITAKTIKDYLHLSKWCLGDNNFLPNSSSLAHEWAAVIDAEATAREGFDPDDRDAPAHGISTPGTGPLLPLVTWARQHFPTQKIGDHIAGFRMAYQLRMNSAPGVASSGDAEIGTSLTLHNNPILDRDEAEGFENVEVLMKQVTDQWLTPNGDEIDHAIHTFKWLYELSAGFYNELTWPVVEQYAERKKINEVDATSILDRAREHHELGQLYAKDLRTWLEVRSKPGMDTPLLVGQEMSRHGSKTVGEYLFGVWNQWKESDFEGRPDRDSRAVRMSPFKVDKAVEWAKEIKGGALIWVYHVEIGIWLTEAMRAAGIDVLHCPSGNRFNTEILKPENSNKKIVASMSAHGTGKNLQHFEQQYFVQWPRQATMAEQVLGRTHRNGQKADELIVNTNNTLEFDEVIFAACLNDSLYIHQTTGNRQKLIYANYDPTPKIIPSAVLRERGLQPKIHTREMVRAMSDKFGEQK